MANVKDQVDEARKEIDFKKNRYQIELKTSMGSIKLDLLPDVAPKHCENIIALSKIGFYDNLIFHRVIKGFVIQGGCPDRNGMGGPGYKVNQEFNPTKHDPGVLSMARAQDPNSAGSQFFICLENARFLDNQYTAFGKTADDESLAVVMAIGKVSTRAGDRPAEDVIIEKATVHLSPL